MSKWIAGLTGKDLEAEIAALNSEQMTALLTHLKPHLAAELLQVTGSSQMHALQAGF